MGKAQEWLARFQTEVRHFVLCPLGFHVRGEDFCAAGCGAVLRPRKFARWRITLRDGSSVDVNAVNEYHALSQVVYGTDKKRSLLDRKGKFVVPPVRVHPSHIVSAETVREHE